MFLLSSELLQLYFNMEELSFWEMLCAAGPPERSTGPPNLKRSSTSHSQSQQQQQSGSHGNDDGNLKAQRTLTEEDLLRATGSVNSTADGAQFHQVT